MFKITSESGVGAGVRRIEAVTSKEAYEFLEKRNQLLESISEQMKIVQLKEIPHKLEQYQAQIKDLEQQKQALEDKFAQQQADSVFKQVEEIKGKTLIKAQVKVSGMAQLRQLADQWKTKKYSDVLVLATATKDGKVNLIAAASASAVKAGLKAGDLIKTIAPSVGGGGGGRPDLAQAGGKTPAGIADALKAASEWLEQKA
ncbi:alanyl-tRNA synthetase [Liquorilactobacillus sucicola DSM 21376 = JCM 15457]|nr:alanyl-tRNA synthetase [Liquorilactobacillus sucicola DSM 21376 = JCM 15457]